MPDFSRNNAGKSVSISCVPNTKLYFQKKDFLSVNFLKDFNLLDYGQNDKEFVDIYDSDSRVEKYINAEMSDLPKGFCMAGHGYVTRDSCGRFNGVRSTKQDPKKTLELMHNTCNKLGCPICVRKACNVKAQKISQKIKDYIWFMITQGVDTKSLVPCHFTLNPNYVDKNGIFHENFVPEFTSMQNFHKSIKKFINTYINPYLDASVIFFHLHRFKDAERSELKVSIHFHVIGFGKFPKFRAFKKVHGFLYTNEGYLDTPSDIFRVARYELTHVVYPQKIIQRHSIMSESELAYRKKEKDFVNWLLKIDFNEVTREQTKESLHSYHSYFYAGNLSPYNIRYLKCKKKKRTPNGLKKVTISLPMRHIDTNDKVYQITAGVIFRKIDQFKRWKYFTLDEMHDYSPVVSSDIQLKFYYDRLKWGKLYRQKKNLNWITIRNFKINRKIIKSGWS